MKLKFGDILKNTSEIKAFVAEHRLQTPNSTIFFPSSTNIRTSSNSINLQIDIRIEFGGFDNAGTITIMDPDKKIDPMLFPESFDANWQSFSFEGEFLKIIGHHKKNPKIGNYEVKIFPK